MNDRLVSIGQHCLKLCERAAGQLERRCAAGAIDDADVLHEHATIKARPHGFGKGFLGGETLGERPGLGERSAVCLGAFDFGENALLEPLAKAIERILDPLDVA